MCSIATRSLVALAFAVLASSRPAAAQAGFLEVDYSALVDRRQISHSGESVGMLLDKLGGRPLPPPGERPVDRLAHTLLDPLAEPYAFVLTDSLDMLEGLADPPLVEIGRLVAAGGTEPAWMELLRARRLVVESDGAGRFRMALPQTDGSSDPAAAARGAFTAAWPVLRHVLAAERRRLAGSGGAMPPLAVRVYAYRHQPARSRFDLGAVPWDTTIDDTRPDGRRPPLDLAAWQAFLDQGLQLEGARVEEDGSIRLLGSRVDAAPTLAGSPIGLGDLAVAYRAVFHGGLAEPYMSLDRGFSPQTAIVNYGGRLRDTRLGMVSLLCDIRFKTFSLGLDIRSGQDLRGTIRGGIPGWKTHMERFAEDPGSADVVTQQTRLWFYPDRVDLTLSAQNDVLVMRRVRMSAASERVPDAATGETAGGEPPWTTATVEAINGEYDALAGFFPELAELDQAVRLLSLFTWLRVAGEAGIALPELDTLLAVELPAQPTPRTFPQLLAFNALPPPGGAGEAMVYDRVPVAEALDRLGPSGGELPAPRRLERALAALDPADPQSAALIEDYASVDPGRIEASLVDVMAYRAERLRMHYTVLGTLPAADAERVGRRQRDGEDLRVFSVGIGGLDLGMGQVLARAGGNSLALRGLGDPGGLGAASSAALPESERPVRAAASAAPREAWRGDPVAVVGATVPDHGARGGQRRTAFGDSWVEVMTDEGSRTIWTLHGAHDAELTSRRVRAEGAGKPLVVERIEGTRRFDYRIERSGSTVRAVPTSRPAAGAAVAEQREVRPLPEGLVTLAVGPAAEPATASRSAEPPKLGLRIQAAPQGTPRLLEADFPRAVLARLAAGPTADLTPGRPLPALSPLPPALGDVRAMMLVLGEAELAQPWDSGFRIVPGEEDARKLARSLSEWWRAVPGSPSAVAGIDVEASPNRWARASSGTPSPSLLVLPTDGFPGPLAPLRAEIAAGWSSGPVVAALPDAPQARLVVFVSGEAPGRLAYRIADLAARPGMRDRLLLVVSLSGPLRDDVAPWILAGGNLAGIGLGESGVVALRDMANALEEFDRALASQKPEVDRLPGPFLWYF